MNIPEFSLNNFQKIHRENTSAVFGYNNLDKKDWIEGFELYSTEGSKPNLSPLKSDFYRISFCFAGSVKVDLGLENFTHQRGTASFTFPKQIFSKSAQSEDFFGYYLLFSNDFFLDFLPAFSPAHHFPFFAFSGNPFFQLVENELLEVEAILQKINTEIQHKDTERKKAIQLYLYLLLITCQRSYEKQNFHNHQSLQPYQNQLLIKFKKLVGEHYLSKRNTSEYADLLAVTPNHLNRIIKDLTGKTATDFINEMLVLEAKTLLKHTALTISEIAYQLSFSDHPHFNKFFKKHTQKSPTEFREH